MKKILVSTILGLTAAASVMGQSRILLDTYNVGLYPRITYGFGFLGHTAGAPVAAGDGFTVGFYYSTTPATFNDPGGVSTPGGTFVLATGTGATAMFSSTDPGLFASGSDFTIPGVVTTVYLVVIAYSGVDYESSDRLGGGRGHSAVFTLAPNTSGSGLAPGIGFAMPAFSIQAIVPEPSTFALTGLGLATVLIFRGRK